MIHDPGLIEHLSNLKAISFDGVVYRATRNNLDPLAPSSNGGRWMPKDEMSVLYTSLSEDGAVSELVYHWGKLNPRPSKPANLSKIKVCLSQSLRVLQTDLKSLGIESDDYHLTNYQKMQEIGHATAFLEFHGLIVPSARWECENLIVFMDNISYNEQIELIEERELDWIKWGLDNEMLE